MSPSDLLGVADGLRNHQPPRQVGRTTLLGLTPRGRQLELAVDEGRGRPTAGYEGLAKCGAATRATGVNPADERTERPHSTGSVRAPHRAGGARWDQFRSSSRYGRCDPV